MTMLGLLAGCVSRSFSPPRTVSSRRPTPIVRVQPVGLWCARAGTVVVELDNASDSPYFVGSSGSPKRGADWPFLWTYSFAYEDTPSGELGAASSAACACADAACPACEVVDTVIRLNHGERLWWMLNLEDLTFRHGVATLELSLEWSGSYDRARVESATDRAVVTSRLGIERVGETCWKVSALADNKPLQQPKATPHSLGRELMPRSRELTSAAPCGRGTLERDFGVRC
jgi:hypothetical protein